MTKLKRIKYLRLTKSHLQEIDRTLDKLDKVDIYGDLVQNFEDDCRIRETARLINLIDTDLERTRQ